MLSKEMLKMLNDQVAMESYAARFYLALAVWCDRNGFTGTAHFLYLQTSEEREHMQKIMKYILEAGETPEVPGVEKPVVTVRSLKDVIETALAHEQKVTQSIHRLVEKAQADKDHPTFSFLQWFVTEQVEEENQFRTILDKIALLGEDPRSLYMLDKELGQREG